MSGDQMRTTVGRLRAIALVALASATGLVGTGCPSDGAAEPKIAEGIFADLGEPLPSASAEQKASFTRGLAVAEHRFTPEEGLGPHFNLTFCAGCHEKPVIGGGSPRYQNFLLVERQLPDGSAVPLGVNGVQSHYDLNEGMRRTDAQVNREATRNGFPIFGVGLLAELPEESILRYSDPNDADGDGVSGRPNYDRGFVGRFGRKAQTVSVEGFIRGPLFNHMGITSDPLPNALKAQLPVPSDVPEDALAAFESALKLPGLAQILAPQAAAPAEPTVDDDGVPDPELSDQELFDLVSFSMLLAAPRPDPPTPESEAGRALFSQAGCDGCHVPALEGPRGLIPAFTDLLLHDMGEELADGISMGLATGSEFRTQPLWGVVAAAPYLHDGRADTLDDAIRWHGGEAGGSRAAYLAYTAEEQGLLLEFLRSLGGRAQASEGLLPPDEPAPPVRALGGPEHALTAAEAAQFERGRRLFDRDIFISEGLGPAFNGDSCRACHFEPVSGGAGPLGVNVVRQAIIGPDGTYTDPTNGTMAHRHLAAGGARPPIDPDSNYYEWRQTPTLFGIGAIDRIDEAAILAGADPEDADGDGVRGRAHILPDGRLGRFGWKADVPSVEEFLRDALTMETGTTVPHRPGQTFGALTDDDQVPDPEISDADYDSMLFYMRALAPPPRRAPADAALAARGEEVFVEIGCASCHTPALPDLDGVPVPLYSDLLLHDVAMPGDVGIPVHDAGPTEFRTPPLWGIGETGPYMHDGLATTLEAAILRHAGEADGAREAFSALHAADREALLELLRSL